MSTFRPRIPRAGWIRSGRILPRRRSLATGAAALSIPFLALLFWSGCSWGPGPETYRPSVRRVVVPETVEGKAVRPYEVNGVTYYPLPDAQGFVQTGKASWYGKKFHGRNTSNGERYNMYAPTAAHKTLPFGTHVRVTNLRNGRSTVVRINDRGPFVEGRIIDLSYASAREVGLVGPGVADVRIRALARQVGTEEKPGGGVRPVVEAQDLKTGEFTVQVGAFLIRENASSLARRLKVLYDHVTITVYVDKDARTLHRVRVSRSGSLGEADKIEKDLEEMGLTGAFVVRM